MKVIKQCRYEEDCIAQLCPLDETIDDHIWYADEDICRSGQYKHLSWVRRQKSMRKKGATVDNGFFTKKMLECMHAASKKTKGINPDILREGKITPEAWISNHTKQKDHAVSLRHTTPLPEQGSLLQ